MRLTLTLSMVVAFGFGCGQADKSKHHPGPGFDLNQGQNPPANDALASLRGYEATNRLINERLFVKDDAVSLDAYLEHNTDPFASLLPGLKDLLGVYAGDGLHPALQNAQPNGVNMLLWYLAIDGLAADLAGTCGQAPAPTVANTADLKPEVAAAVKDLCAWPAAENGERALRDLWHAGMQSDAPAAEFDSWHAFVQGPTFAASGGEAVRAMLVTMLYNPNFLLSQ